MSPDLLRRLRMARVAHMTNTWVIHTLPEFHSMTTLMDGVRVAAPGVAKLAQ